MNGMERTVCAAASAPAAYSDVMHINIHAARNVTNMINPINSFIVLSGHQPNPVLDGEVENNSSGRVV
jgi:hypothetical protein